ncbi:putative T7SS-secreted protein [Streptomyces specialis]|uniref:putative T7SS-secreted protein n=1 Tax=Streptomyces specialis TaxID=498367 RepID=UPI000A7AD01E|nr:DUF6531 domain-containing protein [Streptomyces specialis]
MYKTQRLGDVGWESGADWVREQSRSLANRMGAETDELDLGQTEDNTKLIYGSPGTLRANVSHLRDFQRSFADVGAGLGGLDSDSLRGETADAFRERVSIEPPKWLRAAEACERAAGALESFAGTVEWAQGQAQVAIDLWREGTRASEEAMDAHNAAVDAYNQAVDRYNAQPADERDPASLPARPGEFSDPGLSLMEEAQEILAEARRQRNEAAETARSAIREARDAAPPKPSYAEQVGDGLAELPVMYTHFEGGILRGTAGLVTFARGVNPLDPYNLTHPAEYLTNLNSTAAGLVQVANDPLGAGRQMVSDFTRDPAEGLGRLVPDVALTVATGGAGAGVRATRLAGDAADLAGDADRARRLADDAPPGTHDRPEPERVTEGTDPVDLASGRMFLPQTDVALPGALPLVFTRRVESGYTAGRFFGPSWSSTVDERLEIDAKGVIHVTADGLLLTYPHPAPGLSTLPESGTARRALTRDAAGDYTVTDPDTGLVRHFTAPPGTEPGGDGDAWLVQIDDRNGHTITVERGADGTPTALVHSGGYVVRLTREDGRITALSLAGVEAPLVRYGYTDGNLTTVTKSPGSTLTFVYDEHRRVTAWIDSNQRRYDYVYDDRDRVVAEGGEDGHLRVSLTYSAPDPGTGHRVTTLTTAEGHTTRHLIDARCRVLATTDALGHTTRTDYDDAGRVVARTDALGRTTAFGYDEAGRLAAVTLPDGSGTTATYNDHGLPVTVTGPDGAVWRQEYDACGNRTAVTDVLGHTTRFTYDTHGHLASVTDGLGAVTRVRCDAAGLPLEITDSLGGSTRYERDAFGRPIAVTDALGATTRLEWTPEGRLTRRADANGAEESWSYDGEGNCVRHTDALGQVTRFEYTHFDLLAARTDPDGARHTFAYDAGLRLTEVTNPQGLTWSYAYDPVGRLVSETDFDGRTPRYTLDPAGQLVARTTPLGETIAYEYDPLGRVIRKDAAGRVTTFAYDPAGRLVHAANPDSTLIHQYDRRGLLKTELADGHATTYAYDPLGRRTRRLTPTGQLTTYGYDSAGRPDHLTTGGHRIAFTHDARGNELERVIDDALTLTSTWDQAGRLATQHLTAGTRTLNHRAYTYRPDGHLTGLHDALRGSYEYGLDPIGRVTGVHADGWTETYAYDAAGNQTSASWPTDHPGAAATGDRAYTGTRLLRAGRMRYAYDDAGRVVLRQKTRLSRKPDTWRYEWDAEDRLTTVTTPDGTRWRYLYDPLGRRTAKQRLTPDGSSVAEEIRFGWDGTTLIEQTITSADLPHLVTLTWDHRGRSPLAQTERLLTADADQSLVDERFFAIATDLIGTPTELIDETGNLAWHTRATLWGTTTWARTSTAYTPLRFPGQYHDPETGLHYNLNRHYDPETAPYSSSCPQLYHCHASSLCYSPPLLSSFFLFFFFE